MSSSELVRIYESRGISTELATQVARQMMADPKTALETHAREELGIHPDSLGRPLQAAVASFVTFSVGALLPLLPFLVGHGTKAVLASIVIAAIAAVIVGSALSLFTGRSWWWSAFRQLAICAAAGAVTYGVGCSDRSEHRPLMKTPLSEARGQQEAPEGGVHAGG